MKKLTIIFLLLQLFSFALHASWPVARIRTFEAQNGNYKVEVIPYNRREKTAGELKLFTKKADEWEEQWSHPTVNKIAPLYAKISDDGKTVATIGNWGGGSKTDDLLVFYNSFGKLRQYSLMEILGATSDEIEYHRQREEIFKLPKIDFSEKLSRIKEVRKKFPGIDMSRFHTGRWSSAGNEWLEGTQVFIENSHLIVFVGYCRWWAKFKLSDGSEIKVDCEDKKELIETTRKRLIKDFYKGRSADQLCYFIREQDAPLYHELLKVPMTRIDSNSRRSSSYSKSIPKRITGEKGLELIKFMKDREPSESWQDALDKIDFYSYRIDIADKYKKNLATLSFKIDSSTFPSNEEGVMIFWLEKVADPDNEPEHAIRFRLDKPRKSNLIEDGDGNMVSRFLPPIEVSLLTVTPGAYHLRGYWSKNRSGDDGYWKKMGTPSLNIDEPIMLGEGDVKDLRTLGMQSN